MPYRTCPKCKLGLSGIEGHREIVLDPRTPKGEVGRVRFHCALCGTQWHRNYVGDGLFLWNPETPEPLANG